MSKPPWMMSQPELEMAARAETLKNENIKEVKSKKNLKKRNTQNQERGTKGESFITDSLRPHGIWNHKFENAGFGTVFDKLIIPPGGGYGVEVKVRQEPRIAHNLKSISKNERQGLEKFMNQVGRNHAFIIGIWLKEDIKRAFLIPWHKVREQVLSGVRGSINMLTSRSCQDREVFGI